MTNCNLVIITWPVKCKIRTLKKKKASTTLFTTIHISLSLRLLCCNHIIHNNNMQITSTHNKQTMYTFLVNLCIRFSGILVSSLIYIFFCFYSPSSMLIHKIRLKQHFFCYTLHHHQLGLTTWSGAYFSSVKAFVTTQVLWPHFCQCHRTVCTHPKDILIKIIWSVSSLSAVNWKQASRLR